MSKPVNDGEHRSSVLSPGGTYTEFSRTSSGWTVWHNPKAYPEMRWRITHPIFGQHHFEHHHQVLEFTVAHMRDTFIKTYR